MNPEHPARLRVGVIGPGRAGIALSKALANAGHTIAAAAAISQQSRDRVERFFPAATIAEPAEVLRACDLALFTVPDDDLPGLVRGLAVTGAPYAGRIVVHASGRYGIGVLKPAAERGALPLALHPVMTFVGREGDADRISGVSFGVTAPEELLPVAQALVIEMGGEPVVIAEKDRELYHAALAGTANHLVTLVNEGADLLGRIGVQHPAQMLGPLLAAALDNALRLGDAGLTGPVMRGDDETVAGHRSVLRATDPGASAAYVALARLTAERALAAGLLKPMDAERVLRALEDEP